MKGELESLMFKCQDNCRWFNKGSRGESFYDIQREYVRRTRRTNSIRQPVGVGIWAPRKAQKQVLSYPVPRFNHENGNQ